MKPPRGKRRTHPGQGGGQPEPKARTGPTAHAPKAPWPPEPAEGVVRIWGVHAVESALANDRRRVLRLVVTENAEHRLATRIEARAIEAERASPRDLDRLVGPDAVHQGAMVEAEPLEEPALESLVRDASASMDRGPLVVLDQVTDPHNVGAILRSAAAFGATGLIMTRRHSPPLGGVLAKAASGALEMVPIALVGNLARTLAEIADAGVRVIGLDAEGDVEIDDEPFEPPVALVLGAEGRGLRRLTREHCHRLARIGMTGSLASLNVSNAAAVALYAAQLRKRAAKR